MSNFSIDLAGYSSAMSKIVFDGNGSFMMERLVNHELFVPDQLVVSGTYVMDADDIFEISQVEEGQAPDVIGSLALAHDKKSFVYSRINDPDIQEIGFGVRLLPSDCDTDTDIDADGSDIASFIDRLTSGGNTISLEEFSANFG